MADNRSALIWLWLAVVVCLLDQATKVLAESVLTYGQPVYVLPVLDFTLLYNPGAAFSFLADQGGWQRWFFTAVSVAVSIMLAVWLKRLPREQVWLPVALALILGGAVGNLFDRIVYGHVVDFISVHWDKSYFPAFNLADSAITVGAAMMALDVVREFWQERKQAQS
ncbi:signal peptidase II [Thalassolituus marinus]|jgi:signal peptidase II|uniref:Lipoprotein signal peptidase n=1 Tax=Thalassolituus marinus TaxID=671053 RepID=A0ABS7ZLR0_9GAMM|nr:signal peptidase II [Thalassolituus marinus]MCA6061982.1 lipoprotein signal peptidase [Thalassolituus marinus]